MNILYRDEIAKAKDPAAERKRLIADYNERFASPWIAAELGCLDHVIEPQGRGEHPRRGVAARAAGSGSMTSQVGARKRRKLGAFTPCVYE